MNMNNYLNSNKDTSNFFLKLLKDYQKATDENKILKNSIKNSTKSKKENLKPKPKFYLTPKTSKLIVKSIKQLKQIDPISGWFVHLLLISGCRGTEIQKVKMQDITRLSNKTGETFYNIKVNVAKKRSVTCIREIVIDSKEFDAIQIAHKNHFKEKNLDTRRTYLFQKTKHIFKENQISIINISKKFKNLLKKSGFKANKSLHLCRNLFISNSLAAPK
ncbi:site-specific integrase [Borreliella japonica]|uniref:site-specific integrase n=1 Tax=Borreliella japonica TaxID=34095 RepID=UPI003AF18C85